MVWLYVAGLKHTHTWGTCAMCVVSVVCDCLLKWLRSAHASRSAFANLVPVSARHIRSLNCSRCAQTFLDIRCVCVRAPGAFNNPLSLSLCEVWVIVLCACVSHTSKIVDCATKVVDIRQANQASLSSPPCVCVAVYMQRRCGCVCVFVGRLRRQQRR